MTFARWLIFAIVKKKAHAKDLLRNLKNAIECKRRLLLDYIYRVDCKLCISTRLFLGIKNGTFALLLLSTLSSLVTYLKELRLLSRS